MKKQGQEAVTGFMYFSFNLMQHWYLSAVLLVCRVMLTISPMVIQAFHIYWHFRLRLFSYLLGLI